MKTNKKAFTLIEILLAITLMSLIFVGVYSAFWGGISLSKRSEDNSELFREIRWGVDLMSGDLENMVTYDFSGSYPDKSAFIGNEEKVSFIIEDKSGLSVVSYYLLKPDAVKRHQVIIGQTFKKNVSGTISQETKALASHYLVREKNGFIDFLMGVPAESDEIEIVSTHMAEDGLNFSFGFTEENSREMTYKSEWINNYIPSNIIIEVDFLLPDKEQKLLSFKREVLIPSGYGGSTQESNQESEMIDESL